MNLVVRLPNGKVGLATNIQLEEMTPEGAVDLAKKLVEAATLQKHSQKIIVPLQAVRKES